MPTWLKIALIAASIVVFLVLLVSSFVWRIFHQRKLNNNNLQERGQSFETGIQDRNIDQDNLNITKQKTSNYFVLKRGFSGQNSIFNWADHPSLVADAVENGWSSFGFSPTIYSSPSIRTARSLLGSCAVGDNQSIRDMETSWEICQEGSADFGQIIRFHNQELQKKIGFFSVIKTSMPLPGPSLGDFSSFPHECYFEITILSLNPHNVSGQELIGKVKEDHKVSEGEKIKLIEEDYNANTKYTSEPLIHVSSSHRYVEKGFDEMKHARKENGKFEQSIILSVGLTAAGWGGGNAPVKLPGSYPGSIGFNSNGSVFLDGIKLVLESPLQEWGKPEKVIGCGYNPSKRKVYFTVDSHLIHEIHCKSDTFSSPLYPTLAANTDITSLLNLGQSAFNYAPANLQRTPNPSFIGPLVKSPTLGFDSGELFSMRRGDSHKWLNRNETRRAGNGIVHRGLDYDEESEGDLFEIKLERSGTSPYTYQ